MNKPGTKSKKPTNCYFCSNGSEPSYKDNLILRRFISDRGKIIQGKRSGNCSSHQRKISTEIKKARFMAMLPYTDQHSL